MSTELAKLIRCVEATNVLSSHILASWQAHIPVISRYSPKYRDVLMKEIARLEEAHAVESLFVSLLWTGND